MFVGISIEELLSTIYSSYWVRLFCRKFGNSLIPRLIQEKIQVLLLQDTIRYHWLQTPKHTPPLTCTVRIERGRLQQSRCMGRWVVLLVVLRDRHHKGPTKRTLQMGESFRIKSSRPLELMGKHVSTALSGW